MRNTVDASAKQRTFVLTGSASPRDIRPLHSGVGRIEKLRMRTMSLFESGISNAGVSLRALFSGKQPRCVAPALTLEDLATQIVVGGWPKLLGLAEAPGGTVYYYRDANGLEVDAIIECPDGRWGAIEIKLGRNQADAAAAHLLKLRSRITDAGGREPAFLATIEGLSSYALARPDGALTIPIATLAP